MDLAWYVRRLRAMSVAEMRTRVTHARRQRAWRSRQVLVGQHDPLTVPSVRAVRLGLPADALAAVDPDAAKQLVAEATDILEGRWTYFGTERTDLVAPAWSTDPLTGRTAPALYAFDVPYRDEAAVGNIKRIWEPSRHHHLTVLAAAYALTGDERFAQRSVEHLRSWMAANPFLTGAHWTSGIELGIRLISWVWTRRLLDTWPEVSQWFEHDDTFVRQVHHHLEWLEAFHSTGSSANNHVIAEAAGLVVGACAFDWFDRSAHWRRFGSALLVKELEANTFPSGLNRELATEYHGLVLELALVAGLEADAAGEPLPERAWRTITAMFDALAAVVDVHGEPPRQGDADDGRVLVVDAARTHRWWSLLATGEALVGSMPWWPTPHDGDVRTPLWCALGHRRTITERRPATRPAILADAGMTLLRTMPGDGPEVWVRCDAGPHGFLSIAAHGHADALAVEVRIDGVDVLADPGTYCYHGEPKWRSYFRGTRGHNTIEVDGRDQSVSGGPFLWVEHAPTVMRSVFLADDAPQVSWSAEHHGYGAGGTGVVHRRTVELDRVTRCVSITDELRGTDHPMVAAWHLGPDVDVTLEGNVACLSWPGGRAELVLPAQLAWELLRGSEDPVGGWYSPGFDRKVASWSLFGRGHCPALLHTTLRA